MLFSSDFLPAQGLALIDLRDIFTQTMEDYEFDSILERLKDVPCNMEEMRASLGVSSTWSNMLTKMIPFLGEKGVTYQDLINAASTASNRSAREAAERIKDLLTKSSVTTSSSPSLSPYRAPCASYTAPTRSVSHSSSSYMAPVSHASMTPHRSVETAPRTSGITADTLLPPEGLPYIKLLNILVSSYHLDKECLIGTLHETNPALPAGFASLKARLLPQNGLRVEGQILQYLASQGVTYGQLANAMRRSSAAVGAHQIEALYQ